MSPSQKFVQHSDHLDPFSEGQALHEISEESVIYHENLKWFMLLIYLSYNTRGSRSMCPLQQMEAVVNMLTNTKVNTMYFLP